MFYLAKLKYKKREFYSIIKKIDNIYKEVFFIGLNSNMRPLDDDGFDLLKSIIGDHLLSLLLSPCFSYFVFAPLIDFENNYSYINYIFKLKNLCEFHIDKDGNLTNKEITLNKI